MARFLVALSFVSFFSLVGHTRLDLDVLINLLLVESSDVVLEHVPSKFDFLHTATVELFQSALENDFDLSGRRSHRLSLTSGSTAEQTSVTLILIEFILVTEGISSIELFLIVIV